MHLKLLMVFLSVENIYFLAVFNMHKMKGDALNLLAIFGTCEIMGVLFSNRIIQYFPDHIAAAAIMTLLMISTGARKLIELDQKVVYIFYMI